MTLQNTHLDKRITRFFNVAPQLPLYRVHHIATDAMHNQPTEYFSAPKTEAEAIAKVEEMQAKGITAWKVAQA